MLFSNRVQGPFKGHYKLHMVKSYMFVDETLDTLLMLILNV